MELWKGGDLSQSSISEVYMASQRNWELIIRLDQNIYVKYLMYIDIMGSAIFCGLKSVVCACIVVIVVVVLLIIIIVVVPVF